MGHWIINGKQYSEEEYAEYEKQQAKEFDKAWAETSRLIRVVYESYMACDKYMEEHPGWPYGVKDEAGERELKIYQKLRLNLGAADQSPRCEKVREGGTRCGSPQMKGYRYCYAHERMLQMQSQKLELPALEDANAVQIAIMRVQKALIDDEISEKKARLLLYSIHLASVNLKHTTFASTSEKAIVEIPEPPQGGTSRVKEANGNWHVVNSETQHLTTEAQRHGENLLRQNNAEERGSESAVSNQESAISQGKGKNLPRINADARGSGKKLPKSKSDTKTFATEAMGEHRGKGQPQPGAPPPQQAKTGPVGDPGAVPHEHRLG